MSDAVPIALQEVSYSYGAGALRKQILFDISTEIKAGEIVILTGPSGSGKTTLLTLIGALRSAQQGSIEVLGQQLNNARERTLVKVRRQIGYVFQSHNLLRSLNIQQNVQMALQLAGVSPGKGKQRALEVLERVGLADSAKKFPEQLSGGQKQRAGIARALVNRPGIILADEPTASLDKQSGRDVVNLIQSLAREDGAAVILVTHDNRILDVADHILHLEDGHMKPLSEAVSEGTSQMLNMLEKHDPEAASFLAAFAFALARVAWSDSVVQDSERERMREILQETADLAPHEVEFVMELAMMQKRARDGMGDRSVGQRLDAQRSEHFVRSLYAIAQADGEVSGEELREIQAIAAEFGVDAAP
ncbi:MAG: ATP-binding cassette domain-containing protein [Halieaceae bacterium]|jgi:putative ABC transport system ATP-binding protein|nr:ATP-binding cassette domain-containing protein [Halieaceae bacterium]